MEQYNSIQQILKKENGHDRKPIYPSTVIQAVFDAKTGASLEAILAQFNSIYVQYQGSPQATRNIIPVEMRRAGLMITYMNMDSETITEKASSAVQKDNDHWGLDVNWSRVDELSLSGDIAVSANGTWIINGVDTKVPARGSKGDAGLTPWLKTIDNKLHYSYDNTAWEPCSDYLAGYFRFNATSSDSQAGTIGKIQISRDNKTWQDLSPEFRNYLRIQGYVSSTSELPKNQVVGTIYGVNEGTNTYSLHVWDGSTWVNNGTFTSIAAGVVQETGNSETEVMSQKVVTKKIEELASEVKRQDSDLKEYSKNGDTLYKGTNIEGTIVYDKVVRYYNGEITDSSAGFSYIEWNIDPSKEYAITAKTSGVITALAVYKDGSGNYLGYEESSKESTTKYHTYKLKIPADAVSLYFSGTKRSVEEAVLIEVNDSIPVKEQIVKNIDSINQETIRAKSEEYKLNELIVGEKIVEYDYNDVNNWEFGAISNGNNSNSNSRIRTKDYIVIEGDGYLRRSSLDTDILSSYSAVLYVYDINKTFLGNRSMQLLMSTVKDLYPSAHYYRIVAYSFAGNLDDILQYTQYMSYGSEVVVKGAIIDENAVIPRMNMFIANESNNPLYGKKILFAGDSVMAASANDNGWAKIIGDKNGMNWKNIAAGGSSIRRMSDGRRCILDDLKADTGDYDYVIIQGGLNDASNKPSTLNGSISEGYEENYDITKTYPAMEELCRYALTHFANKKVGFLISYIRGTGVESWMTYADNLIKVCEKWGMPYLDLRKCAGFNLANLELRAIYGNYLGSSELYDESKGYAIDNIVSYNGKRYKANDTIIAPAGVFNEDKWTFIGTDYDAAHCNMDAYKLSAPRIEAWIRSL